MHSADLRPPHYAEVLPTLSGNRLKVLSALTDSGPSTPKELALKMGWDKTSVRPRLTELREMGLVRETGERRNHEHIFAHVCQEVQLTLLSA